jgi:hypothetical protein
MKKLSIRRSDDIVSFRPVERIWYSNDDIRRLCRVDDVITFNITNKCNLMVDMNIGPMPYASWMMLTSSGAQKHARKPPDLIREIILRDLSSSIGLEDQISTKASSCFQFVLSDATYDDVQTQYQNQNLLLMHIQLNIYGCLSGVQSTVMTLQVQSYDTTSKLYQGLITSYMLPGVFLSRLNRHVDHNFFDHYDMYHGIIQSNESFNQIVMQLSNFWRSYSGAVSIAFIGSAIVLLCLMSNKFLRTRRVSRATRSRK